MSQYLCEAIWRQNTKVLAVNAARRPTQKVEAEMFRKSNFTILGFMLLFTSPVLGQTTQTLTQGGIESNFLIAPDYKFTEVDGEFAGLAGFYGGWLINQKFLIGGAAYFQTNGATSPT